MTASETRLHKPDHWLNKTFNWELVRGFGQSPIATVSIALPFIGYAILYHDQIQPYLQSYGSSLAQQESALLINKQSTGWSFEIDLLTRLNLIYLGGILIGIGTIIYRIFSPSTIKQHGSITEYTERELSRATARRLRSLTTTIKSRRITVADGLIAVAPWLDREAYSHKSAVAEFRKIQDEQIKYDVMSSFYNVESRYFRRFAVYLTTALYILGFLLLSIPGFLFTLRILRIVLLGIFL